MAILVIGLSMTTMAQNQDDNKNRPKKPDPPQIVAPDKDKPKDRPRDDNGNNNRPKKPESAIFINSTRNENKSA
jgi:hypothetical protein